MKIIELFPPGSIPEGDLGARDFLEKIDGVFGKIIERIIAVFKSTPENEKGPLYEDWKRITGSDSPSESLRRRCDYHRGVNLSNTKEHFKSVNPGDKLEFSPSKVTVYLNKRIDTQVMKSGLRIGGRLRNFTRPERDIQKYEKMRHAHIIMEYKNA